MKKFLIFICFVFLFATFVCINISAEDGDPVLYDGVYEIKNWYTLKDLTVKDYGITTSSDIICYHPRYNDFTNIKNSLWLVTHEGDGYYSFRPIHFPAWGLAMVNNQIIIMGIGLPELGIDVTPAGLWKVEASGYADSMILTNKHYNKVLSLSADDSYNVTFENTYSEHPLERWGFWKLTDSEAQTLEGVIIYGNSVKVGENITLHAGVYSSSTLRQNVTYNSNYSCATVTTSGVVTGVYEDILGVQVVSNFDSACTGHAKIAVVSSSRPVGSCTYLNGVPDNVEPGHDHSSALQIISEYLDNISELTYFTDIFPTNYDITTALIEMISGKAYVFRGHGSKDKIIFGDGAYAPFLSKSVLANEKNRFLSNTQLILYMTCSTGEGGYEGDNLVVATHKRGAQNVIGFKVEIGCSIANDWIDKFFQMLCEPEINIYSYDNIFRVLSLMDRQGFANTTVSRNNTVFMSNVND